VHARFEALFDEFARTSHPDDGLRLVSVDGADEHRIADATRLLAEALPRLGPNTIGYAAVFALAQVRGMLNSATLGTLPGAVFLSRRSLKSTALAAEMLFHEALHAKLAAISASTDLLRSGFEGTGYHGITAVWHNPGPDGAANRWPTPRALAAFHVYAHLVCLAGALVANGGHAEHGERLYPRALFRAHYLGRELLRAPREDLGPDGVALVEWLLAAVPMAGQFSSVERYLIEKGFDAARSR
jgi:hypothetical protein